MMFGSVAAPRAAAPVWTVKTPPTETVDAWLPRLREFLALASADTTRDAELTAFALAAVRAVEAYAGIVVFETTFTGRFGAFAEQMPLVRRPFVSVDAIRYVADVTGEILTPATSLYHVLDIAQQCGAVFLGEGLAWPATARRANAVEIDVTAGFTLAAMPDEIVHAVLMTVAALDHGRGDCSCGGGGGGAAGSVYAMKNASGVNVLPDVARALLSPWRLVRVSAI